MISLFSRSSVKRWFWAKGEAFIALSPKRRNTFMRLLDKKWFQMTDPDVQDLLLSLPSQFDGFLAELATRPEQEGAIRKIRMERIARGERGIIPVFLVDSTADNGTVTRHTFEFHSWSHGASSGAKGLIVLADATGQATHIVAGKSFRFATCRYEIGCLGGFADSLEDFEATFLRELREEIGLEVSSEGAAVIDLGDVAVDAGQTNNRPRLKALILTAAGVSVSKSHANPDVTEGNVSLEVVPVTKLGSLVETSDDSYLLAAISRLMTRGIVSWSGAV